MNDLLQVISLIEEGRLDEAERTCAAVLATSPRHPGALMMSAMCALERAELERARELLERAVEVAPDFADAVDRLGFVLLALGRNDEAARCFSHLTQLVPDAAVAHAQLATALTKAARHAEAIEALRRAVLLAPENGKLRKQLGDAHWLAGEPGEALEHHLAAVARWVGPPDEPFFEHVWRSVSSAGRDRDAKAVAKRWAELAPESELARHGLAAAGLALPPVRASDGYVRVTFDNFAETFDETLAGLQYDTPQAIVAALVASGVALRGRALDAGCGTGLCGPLLRPHASELVGVDLSSKMLARAEQRGCYDELVCAELTAYVSATTRRFDWIVCADTLVYFGALEAFVRACHGALEPGAPLVFSVERLDREPSDLSSGYVLLSHGRYAHGRAYVESVLREAGFTLRSVDEHTIRREAGRPVVGLIVTALRAEAPNVGSR